MLTRRNWVEVTDNPAYRHIFSQTFMPEARPEDLAWLTISSGRPHRPGMRLRFSRPSGALSTIRHRVWAQVRVQTLRAALPSGAQRIPAEWPGRSPPAFRARSFVPLAQQPLLGRKRTGPGNDCVEAVGRFLIEKHPRI